MRAKALLPFIFSALLSLILNLLFSHNLIVSLVNSATLGLSVYFFQKFIDPKKSFFGNFLIISLGLIPLCYFMPSNKFFSFLPLFSLGFCYLYKQFPKSYVLIFWGSFLFFGNLYLGRIIEYPLTVQSTQLIFNSPEVNLYMYQHQQDALFIPYRARLLVYSQLIYVYAFLTNLFNFFNLKNLSDILLLANLYPLFTGIYNIFKQKNSMVAICITAFLTTSLTIGVDRSTDKFQSLYILGPIFLYLILLGAQTINKRLYITLWILSFFLLFFNI